MHRISSQWHNYVQCVKISPTFKAKLVSGQLRRCRGGQQEKQLLHSLPPKMKTIGNLS